MDEYSARTAGIASALMDAMPSDATYPDFTQRAEVSGWIGAICDAYDVPRFVAYDAILAWYVMLGGDREAVARA